MRATSRLRLLGLLLLSTLAGGCRSGILRTALAPPSPHERYARSLREAGLENAALGREWIAAAGTALAASVPRTPPFQETGYFAPDRPEAVAYRFPLVRGQRLVVEVQWQTSEPTRLFLDLFVEGEAPDPPQRVLSAEEAATSVQYEAESSGNFILRLQPELLRGGRFSIVSRVEAALAFPVQDLTARAIGGVFGDARDAGRRRHEGIDIFAPRGTPAVAAAESTVVSAGTNPLGGKVVWLRDARRDLTYYYAHLDEQTVHAGERVQPGETVGLVGDSGNARGGPTHLHFAIYTRGGGGAVDPRPWVAAPRGEIAALTADAEAVGTLRRVSTAALPLASGPSEKAPVSARLSRHTLLRVLGATGGWFRVSLPDGATGYVAAKRTEAAARPLRRVRRESESRVLDGPRETAVVMESLPRGMEIAVYAEHGRFLFVRTPADRAGWLDPDAR
ncbi:MAG: peptidoglycan DD-metalloendopeptidase family protein [Thermoanaerobaculia bacterium]